mgnify:CR=1 FL=1
MAPEAGLVASGASDGSLRLWRLDDGTPAAGTPAIGVDGGAVLVANHTMVYGNDAPVGELAYVAPGGALLYGLPDCELHHMWDHDKVVWCVRLSPDGATLAAAGYDMKMTIYDTLTLAQVHQFPYTSTRGPAFIWSIPA